MANYTRMDTDRECRQELAFTQLIRNIRNSNVENKKRGESCASIVEYISLQFQLPFKMLSFVCVLIWLCNVHGTKNGQVFPSGLFKLK